MIKLRYTSTVIIKSMARGALHQNILLLSLCGLLLFGCLARASSCEFDNKNGTFLPPLISAVLQANFTSARELLAKSAISDEINDTDSNGLALVVDECLLDALRVADRDSKDDQIVKLLLAHGSSIGKRAGGGASWKIKN